jgi:hypothetical protein
LPRIGTDKVVPDRTKPKRGISFAAINKGVPAKIMWVAGASLLYYEIMGRSESWTVEAQQ